MEISKLINKLNEKIDLYLEKQKQYEVGTPLHELYGTKIIELRCCILDICEWAIDEITEGGK